MHTTTSAVVAVVAVVCDRMQTSSYAYGIRENRKLSNKMYDSNNDDGKNDETRGLDI